MIDLTKFGVTEGPWWTHDDDTDCNCGIIFEKADKLGAVATAIYGRDEQFKDEYPTVKEMRMNAKVIASAYEMLGALIEWCVQSEEHFEPTSLFEKTIGIIEKALGLPWPEIRKRLEE